MLNIPPPKLYKDKGSQPIIRLVMTRISEVENNTHGEGKHDSSDSKAEYLATFFQTPILAEVKFSVLTE
jgi:hypothetical protein